MTLQPGKEGKVSAQESHRGVLRHTWVTYLFLFLEKKDPLPTFKKLQRNLNLQNRLIKRRMSASPKDPRDAGAAPAATLEHGLCGRRVSRAGPRKE